MSRSPNEKISERGRDDAGRKKSDRGGQGGESKRSSRAKKSNDVKNSGFPGFSVDSGFRLTAYDFNEADGEMRGQSDDAKRQVTSGSFAGDLPCFAQRC